jgi:hypothetical protein
MTGPRVFLPMATALSPDLQDRMDGYWRAANYLSVDPITCKSPAAGE